MPNGYKKLKIRKQFGTAEAAIISTIFFLFLAQKRGIFFEKQSSLIKNNLIFVQFFSTYFQMNLNNFSDSRFQTLGPEYQTNTLNHKQRFPIPISCTKMPFYYAELPNIILHKERFSIPNSCTKMPNYYAELPNIFLHKQRFSIPNSYTKM